MEAGLLVAYIMLGVFAVIPIYFGSFASLKVRTKSVKVTSLPSAPTMRQKVTKD